MRPLCVDLDGTLIKTDTLWEAVLLLAKKNLCLLFLMPFWLLQGKAFLKYKIAAEVSLAAELLPYHKRFLTWLIQQHQKGRKLVLVTAANEKFATAIADYLGIFNQVFASNKTTNLKGSNKRDMLNQVFGQKQYDYAGNHTSDLKIWEFAHEAIIVNATDSLIKQCKKLTKIRRVFYKRKLPLKKFLKAIRVHQYAKNVLIFVPLLLGHYITNIHLLALTGLGFLCFSILASSVYVLNDLLDLSADRQHSSKCHRAFAAGDMSIQAGLFLFSSFLVIALILALFLPFEFQITLFIYYIITLGYSFHLKQKALMDVLILATLYTLRILAGMAIIGKGYSDWLILFSLFFFTSLAFVKRYTELDKSAKNEAPQLHGRGYHIIHTAMINCFGIASGYLSALVFALYLNSEKANTLYHHPRVLYLACPIILYWLSRIWLKAAEGQVHDDPVVYALYDKTSYILVGIMGLLMIIATL